MIVYPKQHKTDMDKIEKMRQEIKRRIAKRVECVKLEGNHTRAIDGSVTVELMSLLSFLDNLQEPFIPSDVEDDLDEIDPKHLVHEKMEEPDKSLEEAAEEYTQRMLESCRFDSTGLRPLREPFIAGVEWQKQQDLAEMAQSKSPLSVAYANRCFENGKQAMKVQMLKEAVEGEVDWYDGYYLNFSLEQIRDAVDKIGAGVGDKVRIVVLKDEG